MRSMTANTRHTGRARDSAPARQHKTILALPGATPQAVVTEAGTAFGMNSL